MRGWLAPRLASRLALCLLGLAVCYAQDEAEVEPCRQGCDEEEVKVPRRAERSVPVSLIATGMLSRRSALENNFMRFGRSAPGLGVEHTERVLRGGDHNTNGFIRFGRSKSAKDNYMRFGRSGPAPSNGGRDDNYVRFGRPDRQSNFVRFGRADPSNFVRFGRADASNFVRFGRADGSNFVRFGREPSNFVRFGRADTSNFMRFGRRDGEVEVESAVEDQDDEVIRDGRSKQEKDNYMRFGRAEATDSNATDKRAKDSFVRFGRASQAGSGGAASGAITSVRFGRSFVEDDDSMEGDGEAEAARQAIQDDRRTKRPQGA